MKRIALLGGAAIALLLLAALALPFLIDPNAFRPMLEEKLTQSLGREVKLGDLKLAILSGSVTANDLSIADDPAYSRTAFVQAKSLAIGVELWPLIVSRQLHVTGLTIDRPAIVLLQSPSGDWNFSQLGGQRAAAKTKPPAPAPASKTSMDLSVKLVKITGAAFPWARPGDTPGRWCSKTSTSKSAISPPAALSPSPSPPKSRAAAQSSWRAEPGRSTPWTWPQAPSPPCLMSTNSISPAPVSCRALLPSPA